MRHIPNISHAIYYQWRRRESNPRPTVRPEGPYMLSRCEIRPKQAQRQPTLIVLIGSYKSCGRTDPQLSSSLKWYSVPTQEEKLGRASRLLIKLREQTHRLHI